MGLPDMLVDPLDVPWSNANLGVVFTLLDHDLQRAMADEIAGAPGLANTPAEYGGEAAAAVQSPPAPVVPTTGPSTPPVVAETPSVGTEPQRIGRRRAAAPAAAPTATATAVAEPPVPPAGPPPPPGMKPPMRLPTK